MEFIDRAEMEHLLASAKITSMSDIITFIGNNVSKMSMKFFQHFEERISQLEKPKGLDRIMIQEVKTLVEAMIDQREQFLKRELQKNHRDNMANSFQLNEASRRSFNEIDFTNILNIQQGNQSQQPRKGSLPYIPVSQICNPKTDMFFGEVRDLREEMSSKPQRRQLQQLKKTLSILSKQVISKITFQQTEKLMIKFQKQIFLKLKEGKSDLEQIESKIQKAMQAEIQCFKQQAQELNKSKIINAKLQKKVKKYLQEMAYVRSDLQKMQKGLSNMKNQCEKKHMNEIKSVQNLQKLVQQLEYEKKTLKENSLVRKNNQLLSCLFFSRPISFKNNTIVWQNEIFNNLPDYIQFDSGKTQIRIVYPGVYEVCCLLYGNGNCKKAPTLLYNAETIAKFETTNTSNDILPKWKFRECLNIKHQKVNLSVKYQNQDIVSCVLLYISRLHS